MTFLNILIAEKALLSKKLKTEGEKNRELAVSKARELAKLRRKERKNEEIMRRLERSNQVSKKIVEVLCFSSILNRNSRLNNSLDNRIIANSTMFYRC